MSRTVQTTIGVVLGLLLFVVVGFGTLLAFSESSAGCTLSTGRLVTVTVRGCNCGMCNTNDTATIDAAGHKIVVAPKYLQLDGKRIGAIDPNAKIVEVQAARRAVTIVADGKTIISWTR